METGVPVLNSCVLYITNILVLAQHDTIKSLIV